MHYNYKYFKHTSKIDMTENYKFFLKYFHGKTILDLGCGSGRDSDYFIRQNYTVTSVDNSEYAKQFARDEYNIKVNLFNFESNIQGEYDAVWSCASLIHMNEKQLLSMLLQLQDNIVEKGLIYLSLKYGTGYIESNKQRYYLYNETLKDEVVKLGYKICDIKINQNDNPMNSWIEFILQKK